MSQREAGRQVESLMRQLSRSQATPEQGLPPANNGIAEGLERLGSLEQLPTLGQNEQGFGGLIDSLQQLSRSANLDQAQQDANPLRPSPRPRPQADPR